MVGTPVAGWLAGRSVICAVDAAEARLSSVPLPSGERGFYSDIAIFVGLYQQVG